MKKLIIMLCCLSLLLSGCSLWMDGQYHNVKPHLQEHQNPEGDQLSASSLTELREAISSLVEDGAVNSVIYLGSELQGLAEHNLALAVHYVMYVDPIGAYAVDNIQYDVGTSNGQPAAALEISYLHGRSEILRIKRADSMKMAGLIVRNALDNCEPGVVLCVDDYQAVDFTQKVQDYVNLTPWNCMEQPAVVANVYPQSGDRRVIELVFSYRNSREALRGMQEKVEPVFSSAELYVRGDAEPMEKFAQLYSFLMERYDYTYETSITPAYSLLCHGVGDAKAFATVYSAMCSRAGLQAWTVSGTRSGEPYYWNIIRDDTGVYHLDLLESLRSGTFTPLTPDQMSGYVWDYSAYDIENLQQEESAS